MSYTSGGCECGVNRVGRTRLRKVYDYRGARDFAYYMQRRLHRLRLAPAVYGRGKLGENAFYYVTHMARMGPLSKTATLDLGQRIFDLGYIFIDAHEGNIGFMYGRAVVIDCGRLSFRPIRKRDSKTYQQWWESQRHHVEGEV